MALRAFYHHFFGLSQQSAVLLTQLAADDDSLFLLDLKVLEGYVYKFIILDWVNSDANGKLF